MIIDIWEENYSTELLTRHDEAVKNYGISILLDADKKELKINYSLITKSTSTYIFFLYCKLHHG